MPPILENHIMGFYGNHSCSYNEPKQVSFLGHFFSRVYGVPLNNLAPIRNGPHGAKEVKLAPSAHYSLLIPSTNGKGSVESAHIPF